MSYYPDVWRLPGPGGFLRDVARAARLGQHVTAIIPRFIAADAGYSDALTAAVVHELEAHRRLYPLEDHGNLVSSLGFLMTDDFDDAPVSLSALVTHQDVVGRTFVCNVGDMEAEHRSELPGILRRLDDESRPLSRDERCTLVFIAPADLVAEDLASVSTERLWYWGRVSRWDVAAFLSRQAPDGSFDGVLGEIRLETIIEITQWDLGLALELAQAWNGEPDSLVEHLGSVAVINASDGAIRASRMQRPPISHIEMWDCGIVDGWNGVPEVLAASSARDGERRSRLIWRAQARVLMPWLEIRRAAIEDILRSKLGQERMARAVDEHTTRFRDVDAGPIELGTLARIARAKLSSTDQRLRETTRSLASARNRLAHLVPIQGDELRDLVQKSAWVA